MFTQTLAIFHDAYRELNSKKLFWVTLILSGLMMVAFGLLGIKNENTLRILTFDIPVPMAKFAYMQVFSWLVVWLWLTLAAIILALVSTGGLFPDFIATGAIDLYISKPISRLRLFLTKYLAGLLFVLLQVSLFATASFVVLGLRVGIWKPSLFMVIPLVVAFFSYLFSICVFLGIWTRSTVAALLLTMLVWVMLFALHKSEQGVLTVKLLNEDAVKRYQKTKTDAQAELAKLERDPPASEKLRESRHKFNQTHLDDATRGLESHEPAVRKLGIAHRILYAVKTALPKTSETTNMLERWLFTDDDLRGALDERERNVNPAMKGPNGEDFRDVQSVEYRVETIMRKRSPAWIVGTSFAFEGVILLLAAWIFCRRDY